MEVITKSDLKFPHRNGRKVINKGTVLEVKKSKVCGLDSYKITTGLYQGYYLDPSSCEVVEDVIYTEKEWNDMENYYLAEIDKEKEQTKRAYEIVSNLSYHLKKKHKEIEKLEYYLGALAKGLNVAGEAMREMRNSSIQKNG
ncbi:hypothetical protein [Niallia sp. Krafla_26]|uniref:hypothetical protein n=1 Tax=Niallia sp. Krafla_26 TaxID=3064703 RepID=UPI003D1647F2